MTNESAWSGSGGGISSVFARPAWQKGTGVPQGTMRLVPDVAAAADPDDPALIVINGTQSVVGGTSWSAPTWAAFCALINQSRGAPLGAAQPRHLSPHRDRGASRHNNRNNPACSAGVGYDLCTGVGVPDVSALIAATISSGVSLSIAGQLGSQTVTVGQPATFFCRRLRSPRTHLRMAAATVRIHDMVRPFRLGNLCRLADIDPGRQQHCRGYDRGPIPVRD